MRVAYCHGFQSTLSSVCCNFDPDPTKMASTLKTMYQEPLLLPNVCNAGVLQRVSLKIALTLFCVVSHSHSISLHNIWIKGPATIAYVGIHIQNLVQNLKPGQQSVWFSHLGQFPTLSTLDACRHRPASPQTQLSISTLHLNWEDFCPGIVAPAISTSGSSWSMFWRYSITNRRTPGGICSSPSLYRLFGHFAPTWSRYSLALVPSWACSILRDTVSNADTEFVASGTSLV